jgi:hypothetical protein
MGGQFGDRRARAAPVRGEDCVQIADALTVEQVIHGACSFLRQDRQGVALPMFLRQAREVFLARRVVTEAQDGGCGESPREVGRAELRAGGAVALAGGVCGALDEAAIGDTCLPPWETAEGMDLLPPHEREDVADAWDRAQPGAGLCSMFLCRPPAIPL